VSLLDRIAAWYLRLPTHNKILLAVATTMFVVELALRRLAPRSTAYAKWTAFFHGVGAMWTAVILSAVYFVSVAAVSAVMKLTGKDPLDRRLATEPSFWRAHQASPLGPRAAARHQF
jgi:saxitoxin biosynthesis operon SxtJ-like protein